MSDVGAANTEKDGKRMKRRILLSSLGLVAVAAIATATVLAVQRPGGDEPRPDGVTFETATVTRGELTEQIRTPGTLGFAAPRDVGTSLPGTITGLPAAGSAVRAGGELFRVDDSPIVLMHGNLPVWREFGSDMTAGADVQQLEQSLGALGFFGYDADENFDWNTAQAIRNWQKSIDLEQTGSIELGRIVFSPADVRVQSAKAKVGDAASGAVLSATGPGKQIEAFIDTAQGPLAPVGAKVTVSLPGGATAEGIVASVGAPVEREGTNGKSLKIPVIVTLDDPAAAEGLDNVSVTLLLTQVKGSDLLLVPVVALLAQPGGGFAVEVQLQKPAKDGAKTTLVPVELGAFADGLVEVTGGKLQGGDVVVVAK